MKIWYRCLCCNEKVFIIDALELGRAWGTPDKKHENTYKKWERNWGLLDQFLQDIQRIVDKIDGHDDIKATADEFADNTDYWPKWFIDKYSFASDKKDKKQKGDTGTSGTDHSGHDHDTHTHRPPTPPNSYYPDNPYTYFPANETIFVNEIEPDIFEEPERTITIRFKPKSIKKQD